MTDDTVSITVLRGAERWTLRVNLADIDTADPARWALRGA